MILRVVRGRIPPGGLPAVQEALGREYVPVATRVAGLARYLAAVRPAGHEHEIAMMTCWTDLDAALVALDGNLETLRTIDGVNHGEILDRVDHYEVDLGEVKQSTGTPRFLRLTAGGVGHGLDADIQRALRSRLADLPPEVVDAYVGRRVMGSSVEIAFVSTWTDAPPGLALDAPLWPDISAHYESFDLAVYDVIVEGVGRS